MVQTFDEYQVGVSAARAGGVLMLNTIRLFCFRLVVLLPRKVDWDFESL